MFPWESCAIISNHIGQQDDRSIRNAISTVQLVALLSGFFLLVLGQVAARPILTWMGTPPDVLDEAVTYLRIYFLGMPFIMAFNFGAAILRSMGDTRRPLYILVMAGVVNTLLNLLFVIGFGMGVAGVAVATGIANAVSATLIIRLLRKEKEPFRLHFDKMKIHGVELSRMLRIGVPAGVQGMIFSISNVVVQSSINNYGADAIAGSSAALNFEYYCYFIIQGFNGAAIAFIAQNYGAGRMDRVHRVFWICMGSSLAFCAAFNWLFAWQDDFFLGFFSDADGASLWGCSHAHCAGLSVYCQQLRDCRFVVARHGKVADSGRAHGIWNLPVAYCLGVWGIAGVERIRCADDGVSGVVGGYRITGAYGILVVYSEKEIGFELKKRGCLKF